MVQAAFIRVQQASGVLAAVVVALADRLGAEARAPLRHFGIVHRHNDRGHTDLAANGMHRFVLFTDGQCNPLLPGYWTDVVLAFYFQAGGHVGGHHAERVLRRAHVDGLPVAIQHQHGSFRQYVGIGRLNWLPLLVTLQLFLFQRQVCRLPHSVAKWSFGKEMSVRLLSDKPAVVIFYHRAEIGCRGWIRTNAVAFKGRCPAIRRPGKKDRWSRR
jgi:hypothetical protein